MVLEAPEPSPKGPGRLRRLAGRAAGRLLLRDPVECGVFCFIGATLTRSVKHRLFLATYGGFGAALAIIMGVVSGGGSLQLPLMLSFILISGLRAAFNFPSQLPANWCFQVSETSSVTAYVRATRKWVAAFAIGPLFGVVAAVELVRTSWTAAFFHLAFGVVASLLLMEALFLGFRKVPFTCAHFPGKVNLVFLSAVYIFGFTMYSNYMASLEEWLARTPAAGGLFFVCAGAGLAWLGRRRDRILGECAALDFDDPADPTVRTLGLATK